MTRTIEDLEQELARERARSMRLSSELSRKADALCILEEQTLPSLRDRLSKLEAEGEALRVRVADLEGERDDLLVQIAFSNDLHRRGAIDEDD